MELAEVNADDVMSLTQAERHAHELTDSIRDAFRDAHDQTMYIGDYLIKKSKTIESILHRQGLGLRAKEPR